MVFRLVEDACGWAAEADPSAALRVGNGSPRDVVWYGMTTGFRSGGFGCGEHGLDGGVHLI